MSLTYFRFFETCTFCMLWEAGSIPTTITFCCYCTLQLYPKNTTLCRLLTFLFTPKKDLVPVGRLSSSFIFICFFINFFYYNLLFIWFKMHTYLIELRWLNNAVLFSFCIDWWGNFIWKISADFYYIPIKANIYHGRLFIIIKFKIESSFNYLIY